MFEDLPSRTAAPTSGTAYANAISVRRPWCAVGLHATTLALMVAAAGCASIGGDGDDGGDDDLQGTPDGGGGGDDVGGDDGGSGVSEVIDVDVSGLAVWTDTGIDVRVGEHLSVSATGLVAHGGGGEFGPDGDPALTNFGANLVNCFGHVALIGRVTDTGDPFFVGSANSFASTGNGRLFLGVNDIGVDNNAGSFAAEVVTDLRFQAVASRSVTVAGTAAWTDSGIDVAAGQQVTITASGTVLHNVAGNDGCDPAGEPGTSGHGANVIGCPDHAALIGKIGDAGAPFFVGRDHSVPSAGSGRLYLGVNDSDLSNNGGSYAASVSLTAR
jgi:hypothetical protein